MFSSCTYVVYFDQQMCALNAVSLIDSFFSGLTSFSVTNSKKVKKAQKEKITEKTEKGV